VYEPDKAGVPGDNTTLVEVLQDFEDAGWTTPLELLDDGSVRCGNCQTVTPPRSVEIHSLRRLEGASDPDDMLAVLAVRCPTCGGRGVVVVNFGPEMTEGQVRLLHEAEDRRFDDGAPPPAAPRGS
jgi:hypothetical protein